MSTLVYIIIIYLRIKKQMATFGKMTSTSTWPMVLVDIHKKPPDKPGTPLYYQRLIHTSCTGTSGGRCSVSQHGKPAIATKLHSLGTVLLIMISCAYAQTCPPTEFSFEDMTIKFPMDGRGHIWDWRKDAG